MGVCFTSIKYAKGAFVPCIISSTAQMHCAPPVFLVPQAVCKIPTVSVYSAGTPEKDKIIEFLSLNSRTLAPHF